MHEASHIEKVERRVIDMTQRNLLPLGVVISERDKKEEDSKSTFHGHAASNMRTHLQVDMKTNMMHSHNFIRCISN